MPFLTEDPLCQPVTSGYNNNLWYFRSTIGFLDSFGVVWWTSENSFGDGASIPAPLRVILGNSFRADYIRPSALHDYFYRTIAKRIKVSNSQSRAARKAVDQMFYEALVADEVPIVKAKVIYLGVRIGGWHAWNRHAKEE